MTRKRVKHTDQEWLALILDCKQSSVTNQIWCEQHSMTVKTLAYHTQRLRQLGYEIPNPDKPEKFCISSTFQLQ